MPSYEIRRYRNVTWNEETETHDLGEPSETVRSIDAPYPADAANQAESTVTETRTETEPRRIKGVNRQMTVYTTAADCIMCWKVADGHLALVCAD